MLKLKLIITRTAMLGVAGSLASTLATAPSARADVITPSFMENWAFTNADGTGLVGNNPTGTGQMVNGPATPPLGTGSANLATGNGTVGGDGAEILGNTGYAGVPLSALTTLSYSTYVTQNNGQQFPYLQLEIEYGTNQYDQLFFEPPYQTPGAGNPNLPNQGVTQLNQWQTWNALAGGWWDNNGVCGVGGSGGVESLTACAANFTDPVIVNTTGQPGVLDGVGGVQLDVGFASPGDQFNGYVDAFSIGVNGATTTYNFEAAPEPASIAILGAALAALAGARRRYRRPLG